MATTLDVQVLVRAGSERGQAGRSAPAAACGRVGRYHQSSALNVGVLVGVRAHGEALCPLHARAACATLGRANTRKRPPCPPHNPKQLRACQGPPHEPYPQPTHALTRVLGRTPRAAPACLSMSSFMEMPISSSTVTGRFTWPLMQNSLVPCTRAGVGRAGCSSVVSPLCGVAGAMRVRMHIWLPAQGSLTLCHTTQHVTASARSASAPPHPTNSTGHPPPSSSTAV